MLITTYKKSGHYLTKINEDEHSEYLLCKYCKYEFIYSKNSGYIFYIVESDDYYYPIRDCYIYQREINMNYNNHKFKIIRDYKSLVHLKCTECNHKFGFDKIVYKFGELVLDKFSDRGRLGTYDILSCNELIIKDIIE